MAGSRDDPTGQVTFPELGNARLFYGFFLQKCGALAVAILYIQTKVIKMRYCGIAGYEQGVAAPIAVALCLSLFLE